MSIQDVINLLDGVSLRCVQSAFFGEETPRYAYITHEVAELIWNSGDGRDADLGNNARGLIDDFVEGGEITMSLDPYDKEAWCIMSRVDTSRLDPVSREYDIWELRCLDPRPGVRILGGFAEKDVFIALTWDYRQNFDNEWPKKIGECITEWRNLFENIKPFKGAKPSEYISEPVRTC